MTTVPPLSARLDIIRLALLVAPLVYFVAALTFSSIQERNNSDTLLQSLISIDRWTPFFWSENRFGMLLPLIAMPVRDYAWNLLVQQFLTIASGVGVVALLHLLEAGEDKVGPEFRVPLAVLAMVSLFREWTVFVILLASPYLPSLFLVLGALLAFDRLAGPVRWLAMIVLTVLGLWINISNAAFAIVACLLWPNYQFRARTAGSGLIFACAIAIASIAARYPGSYTTLTPAASWIPAFVTLVQNAFGYMRGAPVLAVLALAGMAVAFRPAPRFRRSYAIAVGCFAQISATGLSEWVALNAYDGRYVIGPVIVLLVIALLLVLLPVARKASMTMQEPVRTIAGGLILIVVATAMFGFPSPRRARDMLRQSTGKYAADIEQLRCTHLLGDFWFAWSAVFHDRLTTGKQRLWAVAFRSAETRDRWDAISSEQRVYCGLCSDPVREYIRGEFRLPPLEPTASTSQLCSFQERR